MTYKRKAYLRVFLPRSNVTASYEPIFVCYVTDQVEKVSSCAAKLSYYKKLILKQRLSLIINFLSFYFASFDESRT